MPNALTDKPPLVYEVLRDQLRRRLGRQWRVGDRVPTIKQIAQEEGVSEVNTHRAIRELVREGLLVSRPRRGTFVAGTPRSVARRSITTAEPAASLAGKSVEIIHPMLMFDELHGVAMNSMSYRLASAGAVSRPREFMAPVPSRQIQVDPQVDAAILINPAGLALHWHARQAIVIVSTAILSPHPASNYDLIQVDSRLGGYLAGRWLRAGKARRAVFVGVRHAPSQQYDETSAARLRGFVHGWGGEESAVRQFTVGTYLARSGEDAFAAYQDESRRGDVVFCASDELAVGFCAAAGRAGLHPPRDFQIVGFDGQSRGRAMPGGPLTTVMAPMARMGEMAVELLAQRLADPQRPVQHVGVGPTMVAGATTLSPSFA
jgi:DNA-binding transcriptional regulator YhcF (GntR family)